jgi:large subunit ribosomal protein L6
MKSNPITKTIEIPEGVNIEIKGHEVAVKSSGKEIKRDFRAGIIEILKSGNMIELKSKKSCRIQAKIMGSIAAHIKNMINGMKNDYVYKLEVCTVHFPVTIKVEGNKLVVKNFLGETVDRKAEIIKNSNVSVKGNEIIVSSFDKESAGQTAANIEKATKIRERDRRVFQDGIFLVERCGRKI